MAFLPRPRPLLSCVLPRLYHHTFYNLKRNYSKRNFVSKELYYRDFGEPCNVVKFRETDIPKLGPQDVLVRMLAAPVNPADINTIQGRSHWLPVLPTIAGDEGVGEVIEIGSAVNRVVPCQRVVLKSRLRGTWRFYAIFDQMDLQVVPSSLPLAEAATISLAPRMAYRMLLDYRKLNRMESIVQTAANSPCGQMVIQLCHLWNIDSINILGNIEGQKEMKKYLLELGASSVMTLEEAEKLTYFSTSLSRPVLGINCHGGRHQAVIMKFMENCGTVVNYGNAIYEPLDKAIRLRPDLSYHQFHIADYDSKGAIEEQNAMFKFLVSMMVVKKLKGPLCRSLEMKDYTMALNQTVDCPDFSRVTIFDLSMPP